MVTDVDQTYCDHFKCIQISLLCTPETNVICQLHLKNKEKLTPVNAPRRGSRAGEMDGAALRMPGSSECITCLLTQCWTAAGACVSVFVCVTRCRFLERATSLSRTTLEHAPFFLSLSTYEGNIKKAFTKGDVFFMLTLRNLQP